ncbi:hypothetical protein M513_05163 [Trichuris suis]|uniref:Uncharacterized protein n=1 Tax=Trichuris suis TaxID=68888 RepID=A0A085M9K0_9BILA|nr:hypothetical protein M513_05163 [Trichuris suis]
MANHGPAYGLSKEIQMKVKSPREPSTFCVGRGSANFRMDSSWNRHTTGKGSPPDEFIRSRRSIKRWNSTVFSMSIVHVIFIHLMEQHLERMIMFDHKSLMSAP